MMLTGLIRKGALAELATATQATMATDATISRPGVATVATVIVATPAPQIDADTFDERAAIIQANGIPQEWTKGFATLCTMPCPTVFMPARWQQIIDDGGRFLDRWGRQTARLGWSAVDVFGVDPAMPETAYRNMGLIPLLTGRKVCAVTANTARIDCGNGVTQTFTRHSATKEKVAAWLLK